MKKNDVFTFTAPNGVEVTAVVVNKISSDYNDYDDSITTTWLCYAQNRLFTYFEQMGRRNACSPEEEHYLIEAWYGKVLVDYAILPDYDGMLTMDYPLWEQNMESPDPDEIPDELIAQAETSLGM